jgi:hypothetical protein
MSQSRAGKKAEVSKGDQPIGDDLQPDDVRAPEVTVAVRHEVGYEQFLKELHHVVPFVDLVNWR